MERHQEEQGQHKELPLLPHTASRASQTQQSGQDCHHLSTKAGLDTGPGAAWDRGKCPCVFPEVASDAEHISPVLLGKLASLGIPKHQWRHSAASLSLIPTSAASLQGSLQLICCFLALWGAAEVEQVAVVVSIFKASR